MRRTPLAGTAAPFTAPAPGVCTPRVDIAACRSRGLHAGRALDIALPLVGVLYPFLVYYGMSRIAPSVFALALGAAWLLRAPRLWREPGGRWMLGAALAYCALLAVSGESLLLRWYPTLISLLLLAAFGLSLKFGPPLVERIARAREPDLPAAAIPYTRKVTWAWVGFFVWNAAASAALTLWAPLAWWTLYNGLLAYFIMGALFAGEWLLRQHMRARA